jgi:transposase-like protein
MPEAKPCQWRHDPAEIIVLGVRWYLRYSLSYRDLEARMAERGLRLDHSTMAGWVLADAPELDKRVKPPLQPTGDSWRVAATYIQVKGHWMYPYRAVDSAGQTLDFYFSATRDAQAAPHPVAPGVIRVDKHAAYPKAVATLKALERLAAECELRQAKYLTTRVEQDHRFIKRRTRPGLGFFAFETAQRTLSG